MTLNECGAYRLACLFSWIVRSGYPGNDGGISVEKQDAGRTSEESCIRDILHLWSVHTIPGTPPHLRKCLSNPGVANINRGYKRIRWPVCMVVCAKKEVGTVIYFAINMHNQSSTERSVQRNARTGICRNWRFFICGLILQPPFFISLLLPSSGSPLSQSLPQSG